MGSTIIYEDTDTFDDGTRYEMIATAIETRDDYPEGVTYRFQYMTHGGERYSGSTTTRTIRG